MKIIIYITAIVLTCTTIIFSQSVVNFNPGTSFTLRSGSGICADQISINGTYSGGGTICGSIVYILGLTSLIEGFYNSTYNTMIPDTITVYLRNTTPPYSVIDSAKNIMDDSGMGTFLFFNVSNGISYYIDIRHRNSIETWSAAGQSFTSFSLMYDFSNAITQAYGDNMKQLYTSPLRYAIFSGDINQDGFVNLYDIIDAYNGSSNFITGYVSADVNGDNIVDLSDILITYNNSVYFVSKVIP